MDRNILSQQIKSGTLSGLYIFEGREEYLKEKTLQEIERAVLPAGFEALNETILESTDIDKLYESSLALPFMSEKRLIIAKDPSFLKKKSRNSKKSEGTDENADSKQSTDPDNDKEDGNAKEIASKLGSIHTNPTCITILYLRSNFERMKSKALQIEDKVVTFEFLKEYELSSWVKDECKQFGCTISNDAAYELIRSSATSMGLLELEINKLTSYKGGKGRIELEDVHQLVTLDLESSVLKMIDALLSGNRLLAYTILNSMIEHGESRTMILYMLARQMRLMCYVPELYDKALNDVEIRKKLELSDKYPVSITLNQAKSFTKEKRKDLYQRAVEYEASIKSGKMSEGQGLDEILTLINSSVSQQSGTKSFPNASYVQR